MDTKETVSKKEYDDLVEAYKECQVKYQREVGSIRRSVLQAYECIKDDEWMAEDLSQGVVEALCHIKIAAIKASVPTDD
jgi:hypothetical protein